MDASAAIERAFSLLREVEGDSGTRLAALSRELVQLRERQARAVSVAVAELSEFARSDRAPRELRAAQRRVDNGEFTWEQVVLGPGDLLRRLLGDRLGQLPQAVARGRDLVDDGLSPEAAAERVHAEWGSR